MDSRYLLLRNVHTHAQGALPSAPNQDQVLGAMELKLKSRGYRDDKYHICRTNGRALEHHLHADALRCLRRHLGTQDVGHKI